MILTIKEIKVFKLAIQAANFLLVIAFFILNCAAFDILLLGLLDQFLIVTHEQRN
jgi:hypothetical protein